MSDEILAKLDELKAGQDALVAGQASLAIGQESLKADFEALKASQETATEEARSELTAFRREVNDNFDLVVRTREALSAHLGLRRAS